MAKNHRHIDKEEKKQHVKKIAKQLFLTEGYYNTSMSQVAKSAGIAPNTIYWYFKNKDALFAEVVEVTINEYLQEFQQRGESSWEDNLLWFLDTLSDTRALATPIHELMYKSEEIDRVHEGFHRMARTIAMQMLLQEGANESDAGNLVTIWEHVLEGLLLHGVDDVERKKVCDFLMAVSKKVIREGVN